jgi:hypothetical protein
MKLKVAQHVSMAFSFDWSPGGIYYCRRSDIFRRQAISSSQTSQIAQTRSFRVHGGRLFDILGRRFSSSGRRWARLLKNRTAPSRQFRSIRPQVAPPLRLASTPLDNASHRGRCDCVSSAWQVASMSFWCAIAAIWPHRSPKGHGKQKPAPRGAVKAREATAKRLGLYGEHGDGIAAVAEDAGAIELV